jgi:hypothetical protein
VANTIPGVGIVIVITAIPATGIVIAIITAIGAGTVAVTAPAIPTDIGDHFLMGMAASF